MGFAKVSTAQCFSGGILECTVANNGQDLQKRALVEIMVPTSMSTGVHTAMEGRASCSLASLAPLHALSHSCVPTLEGLRIATCNLHAELVHGVEVMQDIFVPEDSLRAHHHDHLQHNVKALCSWAPL
eukprot:1622375-Amphidinium_carterae.2